MASLNGHTEYTSANALRNSIPLAIDMNTATDRFKPLLKGGYFANTQWNESTFKKNVSNFHDLIYSFFIQRFHHPNEPKKEDLPNGRPLFVRELSKEVPSADTYAVKRNPEFAVVNPRKPTTFGHSYDNYRKTCDIQKGIKVFDFASNHTNKGQYYPNVEY